MRIARIEFPIPFARFEGTWIEIRRKMSAVQMSRNPDSAYAFVSVRYGYQM